MAKTKIIATLGPSSSTPAVIHKLAARGMDVVRLNFSHGSHADHLARIKIIRRFNKKYRRHIRILCDLEGHRIRVGKLAGAKSVLLTKHKIISLVKREIAGNQNSIHIDYHGNFLAFRKNDRIFIDDGNIFLKVINSTAAKVICEVIIGGELKEHKGVNAPDTKLVFNSLSAKDISDLDFISECKADFIAQSFVRNAQDIDDVKKYLGKKLGDTKLIAKIENADGIKNLDSILKAANGIMIARGDLGISLPVYEVPILQKRIIKKTRENNKFVITATQMLESMVSNPIPTRAEVSDIANAILDGTTYVMLSAETAAGSYPLAALKMMNDTIVFTEKSKEYIRHSKLHK